MSDDVADWKMEGKAKQEEFARRRGSSISEDFTTSLNIGNAA
jgi:hypothetical protein